MPLQNIHSVEVDIKKKKYFEEPRVTSNDDIVFIVSITDKGEPIVIEDGVSAVLASTRPDRRTILTEGVIQADGSIRYELGTYETEVSGQVKAVAQLLDTAGERISSIAFTYQVEHDPTGAGYVPTEKDQTFIQAVLYNGPDIIAAAEDVTGRAEDLIAKNKTKFLNPVETVALRNSVYPNPSHGTLFGLLLKHEYTVMKLAKDGSSQINIIQRPLITLPRSWQKKLQKTKSQLSALE